MEQSKLHQKSLNLIQETNALEQAVKNQRWAEVGIILGHIFEIATGVAEIIGGAEPLCVSNLHSRIKHFAKTLVQAEAEEAAKPHGAVATEPSPKPEKAKKNTPN